MIKYSELRKGTRVNLADAVPLEKPFTIFIEPTNVCNFRCEFCPESLPQYKAETGYYHHMQPATFARVVAGLKAWSPVKSIKFYMLGEPLLNKNLPDMIASVHDTACAERIELTTNGSIISEGYARRLVDSGLDYLRVSVYGTGPEIQKATGVNVSWERIVENMALLRRVRDARQSKRPFLYAQFLADTPEQEAAFRRLYQPIADELGIERRHNWKGATTGLVNIGEPAAGEDGSEACPLPFYTMAIKANGDVSSCCIDWNGRLKIGNVNENSLQEIWSGTELRHIQGQQLTDRNRLLACAGCTLPQSFPDRLTGLTAAELEARRLSLPPAAHAFAPETASSYSL